MDTDRRPLRLLSLGELDRRLGPGILLTIADGGGIRGLATLYMLRSIMASVKNKTGQTTGDPLLPCDYFDLIAGTSTGG